MNKIKDIIFIIFLAIIVIGGFINPIINPKNINYIENREALKIPQIRLEDIINKKIVLIVLFVSCLSFLVGSKYNPFIYFRF